MDKPSYTDDRFKRCVAKYIAHRAMQDHIAADRTLTPFEATAGRRLVDYWLKESMKASGR